MLSSSVWTSRRSFSSAFFLMSASFRRFFWASRSSAAAVERRHNDQYVLVIFFWLVGWGRRHQPSKRILTLEIFLRVLRIFEQVDSRSFQLLGPIGQVCIFHVLNNGRESFVRPFSVKNENSGSRNGRKKFIWGVLSAPCQQLPWPHWLRPPRRW